MTDTNKDVNDLIIFNRTQDLELPKKLNILYYDKDTSYQQGNQEVSRQVVNATQEGSVNLPIVLTATQAKQIAEKQLNIAWLSRTSVKIKLPRKYIYLEPCDIITVNKGGSSFVLRINKKTETDDGLIEIDGSIESSNVYVSNAVGTAGDKPSETIKINGPTKGLLLDIPPLQDEMSIGYYSAQQGYLSGWSGSVLQQSKDGGISFSNLLVVDSTTESVMGMTNSQLNNYTGGNFFDENNFVDVKLFNKNKELSSTTILNLFNNNANSILIDEEIIQFKNAVEIDIGIYRLSGLLRGRKGTTITAHSINSQFVVLDTNLRSIKMALSDLNVSYQYKYVTAGTSSTDASYINKALIGNKIKPIRPCFLTAGKVGNDIVLKWQRQALINEKWVNNSDIPLEFSSELYDIEILSGSTVKRTITNNATKIFTYTSAMQITDFGANQSVIKYRVYQKNADLGRGNYEEFNYTFTVNPDYPIEPVDPTPIIHDTGDYIAEEIIKDNALIYYRMNDVDTNCKNYSSDAIKNLTSSNCLLNKNVGGILNCYGFNGTTSYIFGDPGINFGTSDFTIEVLLYFNNFTNYPQIMSSGTTVFPQIGRHTSGYLYFSDAGGSEFSLGNFSTANDLVHFAMVRNSGVISCYINGVLNNSFSYSSAIAFSNGINIGSYNSGTSNGMFNGYMSKLAIYNYAFDSTKLTNRATNKLKYTVDDVLNDKPIVFYPLNEISGTTVRNYSSNNTYDTTYTNVTNDVNNNKIFDGATSYVEIPYTNSLNTFAVEATYNSQSNTGDLGRIIGQGSYYATSNTDFPFSIDVNSNVMAKFDSGNDGSIDVIKQVTNSYNTDTHVAAIKNSSNEVMIMKNGIIEDTIGSYGGTIATSTRNWRIGSASLENGGGVGKTWYKGTLKNIAIYNNSNFYIGKISKHARLQKCSSMPNLDKDILKSKPFIFMPLDEKVSNYSFINTESNINMVNNSVSINQTVGGVAQVYTFGTGYGYTNSLNYVKDFVTTGFTFEALLYPTSNNNNDIFTLSSGTSNNVSIKFDGGGNIYINFFGYTTSISGTSLVSINNWHHVALTFDGSSVKVYVDGSLQTLSVTGLLPSGNITFNWALLGIIHYGNMYYGSMSRVAVYDRVLTVDEITSHNNKKFT